MKKYIFTLFVIVITVFNIYGNKITAYLTYATFNIPGKSPYIETYLSVIGNSVKFVKNANGKFKGELNIAIAFSQNDEIKNALKYTLNSPELDDTVNMYPNFIDQQRFSLANGNFIVEISISDKNNPSEKPFVTSFPVTVSFPADRVSISDIQALESYTKSTIPSVLTKNGFELITYVSTFYPENINKIKFYAEIYNSKNIIGDGEKIVLNYFLESFENKVKLNDYSSFLKQQANDVNVLLAEFNIEKLPSGNYNLVLELRDKENKIKADYRYFFQRKNSKGKLSMADLTAVNVNNTFVDSYVNADTLLGYIKCLRPISSIAEIQNAENQINGKNIALMQQFFYNFWKSRNEITPQLIWLEYFKEVLKVNKEFGTYGLKGYDTDRGRVYLQYGPPDQRSKVDYEPSAYPYEIWEYYSLFDKALAATFPSNRQSNKKFVFYNPDLVTNKYMLIHSNAQGEIFNTRWQLLIHKRDTQSNNLDKEKAPAHFGGNADDIFKSPR